MLFFFALTSISSAQSSIDILESDEIITVFFDNKDFSCLVRDEVVISGNLRVRKNVLIPYSVVVKRRIKRIRNSKQIKNKKKKINEIRDKRKQLKSICVDAANNTQKKLLRRFNNHMALPVSDPSDPGSMNIYIGSNFPIEFSYNSINNEKARYVAVLVNGALKDLSKSKNSSQRIQISIPFNTLIKTPTACFYGYAIKNDRTRSSLKLLGSFGVYSTCRLGED